MAAITSFTLTSATITAVSDTSITVNFKFTTGEAITSIQLTNGTTNIGTAATVKIAATDTSKTVTFTGLTKLTSYTATGATFTDSATTNSSSATFSTPLAFFTFKASTMMIMIISGVAGIILGFLIKMFIFKK